MWLCQCDCGNTLTTRSTSLRDGSAQSCGCSRKEMLSSYRTKHSMCGTSIYTTWKGVIQRCTNPKNPSHTRYGHRGIALCDEWRQSFEAFYSHVSSLPNFDKKGYTLDRIDNDGNYEAGNVRWSTQKEQMRNTSRNVLLTFSGETHPLVVWAEKLSLRPATLYARLHRGWSLERALTTL